MATSGSADALAPARAVGDTDLAELDAGPPTPPAGANGLSCCLPAGREVAAATTRWRRGFLGLHLGHTPRAPVPGLLEASARLPPPRRGVRRARPRPDGAGHQRRRSSSLWKQIVADVGPGAGAGGRPPRRGARGRGRGRHRHGASPAGRRSTGSSRSGEPVEPDAATRGGPRRPARGLPRPVRAARGRASGRCAAWSNLSGMGSRRTVRGAHGRRHRCGLGHRRRDRPRARPPRRDRRRHRPRRRRGDGRVAGELGCLARPLDVTDAAACDAAGAAGRRRARRHRRVVRERRHLLDGAVRAGDGGGARRQPRRSTSRACSSAARPRRAR